MGVLRETAQTLAARISGTAGPIVPKLRGLVVLKCSTERTCSEGRICNRFRDISGQSQNFNPDYLENGTFDRRQIFRMNAESFLYSGFGAKTRTRHIFEVLGSQVNIFNLKFPS
jgi:hypothetical protein